MAKYLTYEGLDRFGTGVGEKLANKANASDVYNKSSIDAKITELNQSIVAAETGKLIKKKVNALPSVSEAEENVIYLVSKPGGETGDIFDEYMLIDGDFERLGSSEVSLDGYLREEDIQAITNDEIDAILAKV